ncbi:MAG: hypothetical protein ACP5OG_05075 [Candidatus Nanoarchaeia archaeon]
MVKKGKILSLILFVAVFSTLSVFAENKLDIEIGNAYYPNEEITFKIFIYDENNNLVNDIVQYKIQDYYIDLLGEGVARSGEEVKFTLPNNALQGYSRIVASYNDIETERLFNVLELQKAEIKLEGNSLIIKNIGNVVYKKNILIEIGEHAETAAVALDIGEEKIIKLTAPQGEYQVKVSDGTKDNTFEVSGVSLTGNVIGLEKLTNKSFWQQYPLVGVFLIALVGAFVFVAVLKLQKKFMNKTKSLKSAKKKKR